MDTTHEHSDETTSLRDRFRGIRRPWRDVWTGMLAAPVGAAVTLALGGVGHLIDPCEGLACIWPFAVLVVALYVLGGWLVIAGLTWVAEHLEVSPKGIAWTVRGLAVATWVGVLYAGVAMVVDHVWML